MLTSSIYRWVWRPYRIEPVGLSAARCTIKHLTSKPELVKTMEALRTCNSGLQISVRKSRKHRVPA